MKLKNDRLEISICEPGSGRNRSTRFDRCGFIEEVTLDSRFHFCAKEPETKEIGGAGLCSEITWLNSARSKDMPYIKFGVGLLDLCGEPYDFQKLYPCQSFQAEFSNTQNSALFEISAGRNAPLPLTERKKICLSGTSVICSYFFTNESQQMIELEEYCHNFITLNGLSLDKTCHLHCPGITPQDGQISKIPEGQLIGSGEGFSFSGRNKSPSLIEVPAGSMPQAENNFSWLLFQDSSSFKISEYISCACHHLTVWSSGNILSPEGAVRFLLQPMQSFSYSRKWTFTN